MRRFVDEIVVRNFNLASDIISLLESKECAEKYCVDFYPDDNFRSSTLKDPCRETGHLIKVFVNRDEN